MKLTEIIRQINEDFSEDEEEMFKPDPNIDADELIQKGFTTRKVNDDNLETGKSTSDVINATNFKASIKKLYEVFYELKKYLTSSDPKVSRVTAVILKTITETIHDIKLLEERTKLIKQGLR